MNAIREQADIWRTLAAYATDPETHR